LASEVLDAFAKTRKGSGETMCLDLKRLENKVLYEAIHARIDEVAKAAQSLTYLGHKELGAVKALEVDALISLLHKLPEGISVHPYE
jgi:hypothetical protein